MRLLNKPYIGSSKKVDLLYFLYIKLFTNNVLKIGSITELEKLSIHSLGTESMVESWLNEINLTRIGRSPVDGPTSWIGRFGLIFKTLLKNMKILLNQVILYMSLRPDSTG